MMTKRDHITIAKTIRDTDVSLGNGERHDLANQMADAIEPLSKGFDREMFMAFATSDSPGD